MNKNRELKIHELSKEIPLERDVVARIRAVWLLSGSNIYIYI